MHIIYNIYIYMHIIYNTYTMHNQTRWSSTLMISFPSFFHAPKPV